MSTRCLGRALTKAARVFEQCCQHASIGVEHLMCGLIQHSCTLESARSWPRVSVMGFRRDCCGYLTASL